MKKTTRGSLKKKARKCGEKTIKDFHEGDLAAPTKSFNCKLKELAFLNVLWDVLPSRKDRRGSSVVRKRKIQKAGLAKLTPPTLPKVVERKRLFRLLDNSTKLPVTWIAGPPGAGKTTLLASYAKTRRRSVIWYRLDAGDADPAAFFHYLGLAVQAAVPRFRKQLPHLTPEYFAGLPIFTQRFFEALGTRMRRPTLMVFDNYHEVPPDAALHQLLPVGIERVSPHLRIVILSRETYPKSYIRLAMEQQLHTIRSEELDLTRTEACQVYRLQENRLMQAAKSTSIDDLWGQVRGWMAGFILLLERGIERGTGGDLNAQGNPQAVFEYLASEVMTRLPADTQQVLIAMSLVGDFKPKMAMTLTGHPEAEQILERLHQARYFIERREDRAGWYRYHPLFREFLQRRAQLAFDPPTLRRLRESAASLLIDAQLEGEAVDLLEAAADWESYRSLIRSHGPILVEQGRVQTLESWIMRLPEAERAADPWMDLWLAQCRLAVVPKEATAFYESAFTQFRKRGEQEPMLLAWAGVVHSIIFSYAGIKRLNGWLHVFEEIHSPGSSFPSLQVEALVVEALAVSYVFIAPDRPEARQLLDRTVDLWNRLPDSMRPPSKYFIEQYYIWFDDFTTVYALFAKSAEESVRSGVSPMARIHHSIFQACLGWLTGNTVDSRKAVREGMAHSESSGLIFFHIFLVAQGVYNELMIGDTHAASSYLDQMTPLAESMGHLYRLHVLMLSSWVDLIEGQVDQAWSRCRRGRQLLEEEGGPVFIAATHDLIDAQALMGMGQRVEAEETLARVETVGRAMPSMQLTIGVYFLRAQWAFQDGDDVSGRTWLRLLLEEGQTSPRIGFVGWVPQEASRLFAKALELGIEVPYALEVIRKRQLKPPTAGSAPENWPWRVKIHTFGKLFVEVDGKPLEKQRKAPHRLLELLVAIIAFGGHDVPVSRLIDALWPEVDGDTGYENFKKSIARLRKLLAVDDVIQWQDGKVSLNPAFCWIDALAFERHAKQQDGRAMVLYAGPFLGSGEIPAWAESRRDHERTRFILLVNRHCDEAQRAGNMEEAIRSLERAIEVDPVAEPFYQRLIPLLAAHGRQVEAQRYYQACKNAFQRWRTGNLSPETLLLGQSLGH